MDKMKQIIQATQIQTEIEKYGVTKDTFEYAAVEYALHWIKNIQDPTEAAKKFKEIIENFRKTFEE